MIGIIYSADDPASANAAGQLKETHDFSESRISGRTCWKNGDIVLWEADSRLIDAKSVDTMGFEVAYFLSKHKSANGVGAFTTHPLGNWTAEAAIGGTPRELSIAAPAEMLCVLAAIARIDAVGIERTYEATHHGPLLRTPSLFVELGGNDAAISNVRLAHKLADAVFSALSVKQDLQDKVVIGIGGTHYPAKFTKLALEKGYAFAHMMPKHAILNDDGSDNLGMLSQAVERSKAPPEAAVIDWKSINAETRNKVLKELSAIGIDYERV
ncbi:MAG: hypothetical protein KGH59_03445 [Candidatus Micrarchaeota archaeon]|nr:hypothetical protein [Candidatus Micrarchaeota archaeon]MDE1804810.1 hypothetical protein [Candidatus Micrarchaeota archaeon]